MGEMHGHIYFQGSAVDDLRRSGGRNGDAEVADGTGMVTCGGVGHRGRLQKVVTRCVAFNEHMQMFIM